MFVIPQDFVNPLKSELHVAVLRVPKFPGKADKIESKYLFKCFQTDCTLTLTVSPVNYFDRSGMPLQSIEDVWDYSKKT